MRNMWQIVVGGVIAIGVAVALYNSLGGDEPTSRARPSAPPVASAAATTSNSETLVANDTAPQPDGNFGPVTITDGDYVLGRADAPITIIEFASLTCPHCADFHNNVLPELKKHFIDTGKVRLVFRDFPLDRFALVASIIARCAGRDRYFGFIDALFKDQRRWAGSANPMQSLGRIAQLGGLPPKKVEACLKDEALQTTVLQGRVNANKTFQISATPTLIINGYKFSAGLTFAQIKAVLEPMLPKS